MTRCVNCGDPARYVIDGDDSEDGALCASCAPSQDGQQTLTTGSDLSLDAFGGGA